MRHAVLIISLLLAISGILPAQSTMSVRFLQDQSRTASVNTFSRNGALYASVADIAKALGISVTPVTDAKKVELKGQTNRIRLSAENPFVVVTDEGENSNLLQLPLEVTMRGDVFFVPIEAFLPVLKALYPGDLALDRNTLNVGKLSPRSAYDVTGLSFDEKSNGFLIRIHCTKKLPDFENWMKPIGNDTWMYITLANARADVNAIKNTPPSGLVKQVLVFQSPTSVQLTLRLKGQIGGSEILPADGGSDILVAINKPADVSAADKKPKTPEKDLDKERKKWKLDVVVLDAGHGGEDPGAIGVTKTKEKDITLGITKKLGALISKNLDNVEVVYTRQTDKFIELYRRGQIANENGGKLFISIHCNSMPRKPNPNSGFEVYLLRPGKTENALRIAERENEVVKLEEGYEKRYQKLTEENFILLSMAQSAYVRYSEKFAGILGQEMGKQIDIPNDGVKQAGFYVLVGASMPNVLVETGYLSNRHDEKILKSPQGQQKIAQSIFNAIRRYKDEYEKSLREGVDMSEGTR
jgi:N-acetylmuramoyl-L-alanine amidase